MCPGLGESEGEITVQMPSKVIKDQEDVYCKTNKGDNLHYLLVNFKKIFISIKIKRLYLIFGFILSAKTSILEENCFYLFLNSVPVRSLTPTEVNGLNF